MDDANRVPMDELEKLMNRELTLKERRFAEEYVIDLDRKATAERVGISTETAANYLNRQLVRDYIQHLMDERAKKTKISAEYVLHTIRDTVERCRQVAPVMVYNKDKGEYVNSGVYRFDATNVLKGAELLGRHLVLFTDKVEQSGLHSVSEIDEKLNQLLAKYKE